ncbi:hypothetical protein GE061_011428 [Apolygus lucorum]|uniref:Peptidase S1 domain-containing protein n=1 Tax=Apolygus lucorum TaxID=248454 RepID=A0A8S9Y048_APOLU|nr:hypothetical protein GE061_011428 [Apolygus lucorum]
MSRNGHSPLHPCGLRPSHPHTSKPPLSETVKLFDGEFYVRVTENADSDNVGNRYGSKGCSTGTRSSSSWVLWEPQQTSSAPHNPWCSLLTILVLFLVILGVLAVAGLALYMGALRLEPVQSFLIFDGSMRAVGERYSTSLANKSSSAYQDKSRRYQTLLEAVYNKSLLGPSVHEIFVSSFANGSLIVFFRIILDRRKIPKPINSIEETLKTVILQEASSPLSVLNALRIDPKDFLIKRYLDDPRQHMMKEELSTVIIPVEPKRRHENVETSKPLTTESSNWPTVTGEASVKTLPSQMIQGSYMVTSNEPKTKKSSVIKEETAVVTPTLTLPSRRTTKSTTEAPELLFGMKHSPALKQFLQTEKTTLSPVTIPSTTTTTSTTTTEPPTTSSRTAPPEVTAATKLHYSDEPWKPIIPDQVRTFKDKVDFDYGVGEAEVVLDTLTDVSEAPKITTVPRMKVRPYTTAGIIEEVQMTPSPFEMRTTHAYAEKVDKPKVIITSANLNEQKSMPELSILQQFHDLDALLRTYTAKPPVKEEPTARLETPLDPGPSTVVTLLPVRSNVGIRGALRPRPKDDVQPSFSPTLPQLIESPRGDISGNPLYSTTTETVETLAPQEKLADITQHIFLTADSDMVAIPLQKYFATTSPVFRTEAVQLQTVPTLAADRRITTPRKPDISFVTEGLKGIAIIGTDDIDVSSQRNIQTMNSTDPDRNIFSRKPKMPDSAEEQANNRQPKAGPLDQEMRLLLEEIFHNLTTTARTVNGKNRTDTRKRTQTIDFNFPNVQSQPFDMNNTAVLNKLAKLKIATHEPRNETKYPSQDKVSNKAVATSFSGNEPFRILTKVFNKVPAKQEMKNSSEASTFEMLDCPGNSSMLCGSGECLPKHLRCNKLMDCRDGSDETNCTCADFLRMQFHQRKICDGIYDCWDLSDEQDCDWCSSGQHICSNSKMCIDNSQVCDGFPHCPYGDDEKNCITVSPTVEKAIEKDYFPSGYVMVRKEGEWGKMCFQNFDNVIVQSKSDWSLEDLGQSVCRTLTYRNFDGITRQKDITPRSISSAPVYYELALSSDRNSSYSHRAAREKFSFQKTTCLEKEVAEIKCSGLECGIRPEATIPWANERRSRIVGGGNAGPGAWPWQAALYKEGEFQCGATLISDTWLLSAGHCFYNAQRDYWVARLGALRRGTPPAPYEQLRTISQIILHPEYQDQGFINDISLLKMSKPIALTTYVRPICLPSPSREPRDGAMCTVVGWGQLFEVARVFPDTLQEVQLPVISTAECRKRTVFLPLYKVTDNMFCAGYERGGRDACLGDSGGPLMCQENDGRWSLAGVTSNGYGCARANRPGVYTKVVNYLPWVEEVMKSEDPGPGPPVCQGHRCPLGECLPPARLCNGFIECRDSSDERGCW